MEDTNDEPATETITSSNIDEIVETLYNSDDELIGYACKQILEQNTVEPMEVIIYMDVMTPKEGTETADGSGQEGSSNELQESAIQTSQEVFLRELSREFQIDPTVSRGIRCFDLPVDGSTWIVQMRIETKDFREETLFGGCRKLEWDSETQDCNFYEARMKGSYIGNVATDNDGNRFSDVIGALEELVDGPKIVEEIYRKEGKILLDQNPSYQTAFVGFPQNPDNPNFQGGADQGRDTLKEPTNIKTAIDSSEYQLSNRKTITVVGGLLVACFSIAFLLVGYILFQRRRSYHRNLSEEESYDLEREGEAGAEVGRHYHPDKHQEYDRENEATEDDGFDVDDQVPMEQPRRDDSSMSAEAIQMDLGNHFKGQVMGHNQMSTAPFGATHKFAAPIYSSDETEPDDADSWAQTDGTIGSLDLQLEPITAEV